AFGDLRHGALSGDAQLDRDQGDIDAAFDLHRSAGVVHLHVALALEHTGHLDSGAEGGELGRPDGIERQAHTCAVDGHHPEVDGEAEIDLERQRVGAGDASAEHLQDLAEGVRYAHGARTGDVDRVDLGLIEYRPTHDSADRAYRIAVTQADGHCVPAPR